MSFRIIDNKKIDLTDSEFSLYQSICNSYSQGEDLFKGLFETDNEGVIIFLFPPKQPTSMEVIIFLQNILVQQNMRRLNAQVNNTMKELKEQVDRYLKK